jgi:hypothetical protein
VKYIPTMVRPSIISNDIVLLLYLHDVVDTYNCIRSFHDERISVWPDSCFKSLPKGLWGCWRSWNNGFACVQGISFWVDHNFFHTVETRQSREAALDSPRTSGHGF